jgi:hypothetical protein
MRRSHRAPVWQVANDVYLQCVPEKQENLLRARTLLRGSSLARFLALCEGCDIEWKGDGSNTLQMLVEDREHMKEVRYAHRLLTHLVLSAHTCHATLFANSEHACDRLPECRDPSDRCVDIPVTREGVLKSETLLRGKNTAKSRLLRPASPLVSTRVRIATPGKLRGGLENS